MTKNITLHENIKTQITEALRAHDTIRLETLRGLVSSFSYELIAQKSPAGFVDDDTALALIKKSVKQHKDSIEQFEKGGRKDLVKKEKAELAILEVFLPETMSRKDIKKIAEAKIAKDGKPDAKKLGQFMGMLMKELKGKADGADVKAVVEELAK
ncbi:MAG: GatB/YqeY domain-containing protein [Patescibacteria group bacterium]